MLEKRSVIIEHQKQNSKLRSGRVAATHEHRDKAAAASVSRTDPLVVDWQRKIITKYIRRSTYLE
jgi:hypothetical protein